jgi:two-component system cell cycle response regulator
LTARVLVVDDIPTNALLLQAKLKAERFDAVTALSGQECLAKMAESVPDIVLLDVMMPGMDGFEVCRRIKSDPRTAHVPVIMVTALDQISDRVTGLESGADDFLSKPVEDTELFARVRSLVRLKVLTDELRLRNSTSLIMGLINPAPVMTEPTISGRIVVIEGRLDSAAWCASALEPDNEVTLVSSFEEAVAQVKQSDPDLLIVSLSTRGSDGLQLCSQLRSLPEGRNLPILVVIADGDRTKLAKALEMGINDYLTYPVDRGELMARVRTQLRRKRYADRLRRNLDLGQESMTTDQLTGLFNRHYMTRHLDERLAVAKETGRPLSFAILDIDLFKRINDSYGRDTGNEVLKEFASRISANLRGSDLACRYDCDEFIVVMPDTEISTACQIADRLRRDVETFPFRISRAPGVLELTISVGIAGLNQDADTGGALLHRADQALYRAKQRGRNRVVSDAA